MVQVEDRSEKRLLSPHENSHNHRSKSPVQGFDDQVRHGETILIVDRGQPVARLESVLTEGIDDSEGRLVRLERAAGLVRRGITPPHSFLLKNLLRLQQFSF